MNNPDHADFAVRVARRAVKGTHVLRDLAELQGGHPVLYYPTREFFVANTPTSTSPLRDCWHAFPARSRYLLPSVYLHNIVASSLSKPDYRHAYALDQLAAHAIAFGERASWMLPTGAEHADPAAEVEVTDVRYDIGITHHVAQDVPKNDRFGDVSFADYIDVITDDGLFT